MDSASLTHRYGRLSDLAFDNRITALLVIDMQYLDAHPDYGLMIRLREQGFTDAYQYYTNRLKTVVPNIQALLGAFRDARMEVIYTVIEGLTRDGRDRSLEHKRLNIIAPPGCKEAQVLDELAPRNDEIVLKKTCGNVFAGTNLHYILSNIGIRALVICGVVTGGCVESAVRDASSLGYEVAVPEDATATWSPEIQRAAITAMQEIYTKVYSTSEIIQRLPAIPSPEAAPR